MFLYHGTTALHLDAILERGILPRSETNNSNWDCESGADRVYLTNLYAPYFAIQACNDKLEVPVGAQNIPLVIEIDTRYLQERNLVCDEDYMEQAVRYADAYASFGPFFRSKSMEGRTEYFRDNVKDLERRFEAFNYKRSLERLGTCAHIGRIPFKAISKIVTLDPKQSAALLYMFLQPSISIRNNELSGKRYRYWTARIFDRQPAAEDHPLEYEGFPEEARYEFPPVFPRLGLDGRTFVYPKA